MVKSRSLESSILVLQLADDLHTMNHILLPEWILKIQHIVKRLGLGLGLGMGMGNRNRKYPQSPEMTV